MMDKLALLRWLNNKKGRPMTDRKIALVTGANRGIGRAIAMQLAAAGVHVIVAARDSDAGSLVVDEIAAGGGSAQTCCLDVTDADQCRDTLELVQSEHGRLDILVNNAGVALDKWVPGLELDIDVMRETMEVNCYAPLRLCQLFIPMMQECRHGRVVNLSTELASMTGMQMGYTVAYRSAKAALNAMTKMLSLELKEYPDILVNAAAPGWVKTELGGGDATRTPEQGADTPVWLATLPEGGPTGGFYRDRELYPW
jgi:NAD(P)-dependent dehydrogenase (short-subunit alcohol dehydrogenase family)